MLEGVVNFQRMRLITAAFLSSVFLSLLCSLFFNAWRYEIETICLEEGDWQGRITGVFPLETQDILQQIYSFAHVERAQVNEPLSKGQSVTNDVYFQPMQAVYHDMPRIQEQLEAAIIAGRPLLITLPRTAGAV